MKDRPESRRLRQARAYNRRKELAVSLLGDFCAGCGGKFSFYEVDHVNTHTKRFDLFGTRWSVKWEDWFHELEKCQLMCSACHMDKRDQDRVDRLNRAKYWLEVEKALAECPF